jgi:competence protein CoiA
MQIYALDSQGTSISSFEAHRQTNYYCLECQKIVRLRSGEKRHPHFYHLDLSPNCRQSNKSLTHLSVQLHLQEELGINLCLLEKRFPSISRIADCYWVSQKIVFEIQCSPISLQEIQERQADYLSLGIEIVWILHDKQFNQKTLSPAEIFLRPYPHFYTNITSQRRGFIYDLAVLDEYQTRIDRSEPLPLSLKEVVRFPSFPKQFSSHFVQQKQKWSLSFKGDLFHAAEHPEIMRCLARFKRIQDMTKDMKKRSTPPLVKKKGLLSFIRQWLLGDP